MNNFEIIELKKSNIFGGICLSDTMFNGFYIKKNFLTLLNYNNEIIGLFYYYEINNKIKTYTFVLFDNNNTCVIKINENQKYINLFDDYYIHIDDLNYLMENKIKQHR